MIGCWPIGVMLGGHVRAVFTLVLFIFIGCVVLTLYSFREVPLSVLSDSNNPDSLKVNPVESGFQFIRTRPISTRTVPAVAHRWRWHQPPLSLLLLSIYLELLNY